MKHRYTTLLRFTDCGAACSRTWSGRPRRSTPARPDKLHAHMSNLGAYTVAQCLSTCRYTPKLLSGSTWRVRAVHIYIHICTHVNCLDERGITSATGNWSTRLSSTLQRVGSQGDPVRRNSNTSNHIAERVNGDRPTTCISAHISPPNPLRACLHVLVTRRTYA